MREAYQARIGQKILTSNLRVHLNPNFRESGLNTHTHQVLDPADKRFQEHFKQVQMKELKGNFP